MTKQEFIEAFTDWMNKIAEDVFPAETLFEEETPVVKETIIPYRPKGMVQSLSHIARHYRVDIDTISDEVAVLGIKKMRTRNGYVIEREDTDLLIKVIERKYNNFNL